MDGVSREGRAAQTAWRRTRLENTGGRGRDKREAAFNY